MNVYCDGVWGVFCYFLLEEDKFEEFMVYVFVIIFIWGDLFFICWVCFLLCYVQFFCFGVQFCMVYYVFFNFCDIMLVIGKLFFEVILGKWVFQDNLLGMEFLG